MNKNDKVLVVLVVIGLILITCLWSASIAARPTAPMYQQPHKVEPGIVVVTNSSTVVSQLAGYPGVTVHYVFGELTDERLRSFFNGQAFDLGCQGVDRLVDNLEQCPGGSEFVAVTQHPQIQFEFDFD